MLGIHFKCLLSKLINAGELVPEPIRMLLKRETVSGSGISWAICKTVPHPRQITMPAPHHSVFCRPYAFPANNSIKALKTLYMMIRKLIRDTYRHTHSCFTALLEFVQDHPGEQAPER